MICPKCRGYYETSRPCACGLCGKPGRTDSQRAIYGRMIARRRIKDAWWFREWQKAFIDEVHHVKNDLRRGDLAHAVNELLFVEMWRVKILGLDLSRRMSELRMKLLAKYGRVYDEVFKEIDRVTKHTRKEKRS